MTSPLARLRVSSRLVWTSLAIVAGSLAAHAACAADLGAVTSLKKNPLPVYAAPGDATPVATVPAAGLPWPVKAIRTEFLLVNLDGKDVWVDSLMVRTDQKVAARCSSEPGAVVAGDLGASSNRCK
ncbi:hypothetical protein [Variovorax saccharolyticus]|uniref:hypothetical protein n=1 Tax=Variovorax saccharolyticus TaxID=3053516 RepID=UPI00257875A8|nr:hypothetical protein [Variovorax sp. J31P216]MDM0029181.1 hypothetical protein [Variovorax sp. J31P216]